MRAGRIRIYTGSKFTANEAWDENTLSLFVRESIYMCAAPVFEYFISGPSLHRTRASHLYSALCRGHACIGDDALSCRSL